MTKFANVAMNINYGISLIVGCLAVAEAWSDEYQKALYAIAFSGLLALWAIVAALIDLAETNTKASRAAADYHVATMK